MGNFMDLEKMDKSYGKAKSVTDKTSKLNVTVDKLALNVKQLYRNYEDLKIKLERSIEDGDTTTEKQCKSDIEKVKEDFFEARKSLNKLKEVVAKNQDTINQHFKEISNNPELKAHLDHVVGTKFSRALVRNQKEKEVKLKENETLSKITEAAKKDPNVMYMLKDLEKQLNNAKSLNAIIADPSKNQAEIAQAQANLASANSSIEQRRGELAKYFKGSITRDVIDKITSFEDLEKNIKNNNRVIKGINKQNANYETALYNIGYLSPLDSRLAGQNLSNKDFPIIDTDFSSVAKPVKRTKTSKVQTAQSVSPVENNLPAEQPKWYQFVKRFKIWSNQRKVNRQASENSQTVVTKNVPSVSKVSSNDSSFRDSMKYEIVKDYEKQFEENLLREAKEQNKAKAQIDESEIDDNERE